jgi:adenosyl cobinamide kinase/adenosyl cobinamide phosphate guanylyltransferase
MALTFLIGGARSGKSALAVGLGARHDGPVTYVATAPALDDDMARRIERHRRERPPAWTTIEEQLDLAGALERAAGSMVIVDCLTLWVSNLLEAGHDDEHILEIAGSTARLAGERHAATVAISNEVGLGVHPTTELGRRYRDLLGRVNQCWAAQADPALLLVAGRAVPLTDPYRFLMGASG